MGKNFNTEGVKEVNNATYNPQKATRKIQQLQDEKTSENKEAAEARRAIADFAKKEAPEGSYPTADNPFPGMKKGGKVSSASKRADGCITKGHTKGRMV